jgi:hypothetical protein
VKIRILEFLNGGVFSFAIIRDTNSALLKQIKHPDSTKQIKHPDSKKQKLKYYKFQARK